MDQGSVVRGEELITIDEMLFSKELGAGGESRWEDDPFSGFDNGLGEDRGQQGQGQPDEILVDGGRLGRGQDEEISRLKTKISVLESQLTIRTNEARVFKEQLEWVSREYEALKITEKKLKDQIDVLTPKCSLLEDRIAADKEKHERQIRELVQDMQGIEGAVGGMTSTPIDERGRKEWAGLLAKPRSQEASCRPKGGRSDSRRDRNYGTKSRTISTGQWSSGPRRKSSRYEIERSRSKDSLYSSSNSLGDGGNSGSESESDNEGSLTMRRSILLREIPRINAFRLGGSQDVVDFFRDFEKYCVEKLGENRKFWVKELGEFLDSRLEDMYRAIINVGDPKYEVVKNRIIDQVRRIKGGIKYRKKNEFEEARMEKGEKLETFAHRLESLAREKFGDDGINESKDLMRKFLATVPSYVRETINAKRKEKMKWTKKRLMWWDVLEMIEDREIEGQRSSREDREEREVMVGRNVQENDRVSKKSYRDAVRSHPVEVMAKFLEEYEKDRDRKEEEGWSYVGRNRTRNQNRRPA